MEAVVQQLPKVGGDFWRSFGLTFSYVPGLSRKPYNLHETVTLCLLLSKLGVLKEPLPRFLHWRVTCLDLKLLGLLGFTLA